MARPKASLPVPDGADGWDSYAAFYDWENARTVGRRDVRFWQALAKRTRGRVLELGAGTGRLTMPLARAVGKRVMGIDRSGPMLACAVLKHRRLPKTKRPALLRGDIRALPFATSSCQLVIAPYGMLQSLTRERDLVRVLSEAARVLAPRGIFGVDLVPDLPIWDEYRRSIRLRGRRPDGARVTLIESVRQDRRRKLTIFDQEFVETRGTVKRSHRFALAFRTLTVPAMVRRLERAGFDVEHTLGDYRGGRWDPRADVWLLLARRR
jgi:SAM-dependent methyltransferase